ncbi:MAG: hypothetical protein NC912_04510 [Candidatus Omnitrophica bacterium]|nr:hypothetical protein [Candidatus Omnitrophota bacterium]
MKKDFSDLDFEINFYERILKERPNFIEALVALGDAYTKRGFYEKGLAIDKRLVELKPYDPIVFYNLACSYSLLGLIDEAIISLKKAIRLGYRDFRWLEKDADLENLRRSPKYNQIIKLILKKRKQDLRSRTKRR